MAAGNSNHSKCKKGMPCLQKIRLFDRSRFCLAKLLALSVCLCWLVGTLSSMVIQLRRLPLDPEPRLSSREAQAVKATFPLPSDDATDAQIPAAVVKRIHFMYGNYSMDSRLRPFLTSWREVYPDYKIYFWTDREINELVKRRYPAFRGLYHRQLSNFLERSDTARAFILHSMGGWYADIDANSLRRADQIAASHSMILPLEPYIHAVDNFRKRRLVSNAIMYSTAGHPFWEYYLQRLRLSLAGRAARTSTLDAVYVTGPVMLTEAALLFMQAHTVNGDCPKLWCPHLAPPVQFMPNYDDNSARKRDILQELCTQMPSYWHWEFAEDCRRYRQQDYRNHADPSQSYAYHAFLHLNERKRAADSQGDVRAWGLRLTVGADILAELT